MKMTTRLAAAVATTVLLLSACGVGGDDVADADPAGTDTSTEETTDDDTTEVGGDDPDRLVLGLVPSQDMDKLVEDAGVLGDLLSAELGIPVETFVADNYAGLVVAMQTGQADIGMFGPIALVQAVDEAGAVAVLQSVRRGTDSYHTQWVTNDPDRFCLDEVVTATNPEGVELKYCNGTDSAAAGPAGEDAIGLIESGETILFVDASSASGYYYPATQVQTVSGLDPFTDIDTQFAGGHPNAILGVSRGDFEVAVSFDDARNNVIEEDPNVAENVIVFAWSPEIPNDGVAVGGHLDASLQDRITTAFLALADSEEGLTSLDDVYNIEGLVPANLEALDLARQVAANFGD
ncbi:MAG TPA: phosphate/phosphite/phosphonate ABC transporter substrate-binding protein [Intrasporangiaceae bacterium]|nr:phosphate/phosphite/phosphonate ABC transporter substrate-binding protein [Intrasporangiaceae bacterium]